MARRQARLVCGLIVSQYSLAGWLWHWQTRPCTRHRMAAASSSATSSQSGAAPTTASSRLWREVGCASRPVVASLKQTLIPCSTHQRLLRGVDVPHTHTNTHTGSPPGFISANIFRVRNARDSAFLIECLPEYLSLLRTWQKILRSGVLSGGHKSSAAHTPLGSSAPRHTSQARVVPLSATPLVPSSCEIRSLSWVKRTTTRRSA